MPPLNVGETSNMLLSIIPLRVRIALIIQPARSSPAKMKAAYLINTMLNVLATIKEAMVYATSGKIKAQYPYVTGTPCLIKYEIMITLAIKSHQNQKPPKSKTPKQ